MKNLALRGRVAGFALACATLAGTTTSAVASPAVGQPAPAFTATDVDGKTVRLADFRGKYVVLEWNNPGCPFVRKHYQQSGNLPGLQKTFTARGVVWLAVNSTERGHPDYLSAAELGKWFAERGARPTAVLMDEAGTVGRAYGATVTPHMYIVDPQGRLAYAGGIDSIRSANADDIKSRRTTSAKRWTRRSPASRSPHRRARHTAARSSTRTERANRPRPPGRVQDRSDKIASTMNTNYRTPLPGTKLDYFDARAAVDAIQPGAYDRLPYTSRVLAENLVRRCDPAALTDSLKQLIERKRDLDFPWFPARVVCHDILGQTALVDLAGLRDAIADQGGDPAQVNPVVPVQLIVDHSLAVECGGFDPDAFAKNRAIEDRRNEDRFHFIDWTKQAFKNVDVIPPGNGIMHQINLEKMSPVIQVPDGVAFPDTCVGTDSHTPHVDALGVIAIGVGGLEAENVMLGRASWMRLPDIVGVELTGKPQPGITATDVVLALTEFLRKEKVVGAYLEFRGEGAAALTLGDRATISNMAPEYGATAAMFFIDGNTIDYLRLTGREDEQVQLVETYAKHTGLWADSLADCAVRAHAALRPVRAWCATWPARPTRTPASPPADLAAQGHRRHVAGSARPDARRRGDHRRHHQLHQHQQPAQRDRRRPAGAQRQPRTA